MEKFRPFLRSYGVFLVFVPGMVAVHWAWFRLQDNELYVPRYRRDANPFNKMREEISAYYKGLFSKFRKSED